MDMNLNDNIKNVQERINAACLRSGRDPSEVRLIAVSKTKSADVISEAVSCGLLDLGENYPQELKEKAAVLPDDIRWHFIGHLQRNKIKYVLPCAHMIHSVDSLRLAEAIEKEAAKLGRRIRVLIEVNVAGEESKSGVTIDEAVTLAYEISRLEHLELNGLMTIAPFVSDPEQNRPHFRALRNLSIDIAGENIDNISMCELSMGMSGDFETAIEEGATMVRVGTALFGERTPRQAL